MPTSRSVRESRNDDLLRRSPRRVEELVERLPGHRVVCWRVRLGRLMMDVPSIVEMLAERGLGFRSISDRVDPSTPTDNVLLHLLLSVASLRATAHP